MKRHSTKYPGVYYRLGAKNDRRYQIAFTDSKGKRVFETLPPGSVLEDAITLRSERMAALGKGELIVSSGITVDALATLWLKRREASGNLRPKTLEIDAWAAQHVRDELGSKRVRKLTPDDVALMLSHFQHLKTASVRNIIKALNGMMALAIRQGYRSDNPVTKLMSDERPKDDAEEIRILSSEEIKLLLEKAPGGRWRTLYTTLVFTGLRINEALSLTWEDVDFKAREIRVSSSKTDAGIRRVAIPSSLSVELAKLKIGGTGEHVFGTSNGTPIGDRNALRMLHNLCGQAGIERVSLHALRHTCASILIGQGADVTYVASQLGHKNPAITLRVYAKLFDPEARMDEMRTKLELVMSQTCHTAGGLG